MGHGCTRIGVDMNWREGPFLVGGLYRVRKSPGEGFMGGGGMGFLAEHLQ